MVDNLAFDLRAEQPEPNAFIQWKGTDVCMDFHCECGAHHHIDGYFVYAVKCHECGTTWEMPSHIYPRKITGKLPNGSDECVHVTQPDSDQ